MNSLQRRHKHPVRFQRIKSSSVTCMNLTQKWFQGKASPFFLREMMTNKIALTQLCVRQERRRGRSARAIDLQHRITEAIEFSLYYSFSHWTFDLFKAPFIIISIMCLSVSISIIVNQLMLVLVDRHRRHHHREVDLLFKAKLWLIYDLCGRWKCHQKRWQIGGWGKIAPKIFPDTMRHRQILSDLILNEIWTDCKGATYILCSTPL